VPADLAKIAPCDERAGLVLAVADGTPRNPLTRQRRNPLRAAARVLRRRHVLLIADVPVGSGAELVGQHVDEVHHIGQVRVIALRRRGADGVDWSPPSGYRLAPQDRMFVLATRADLSRVLSRSESR